MKKSRLSWLVLLAIVTTCCLRNSWAQRLHDKDADQLMQATESKFKELTSKDHDAFAAAAENLRSIHEHDLDILREKNLAKVNALINRLPFQTWDVFLRRARLKRHQLLGFQGAKDSDFPEEAEPNLQQEKQQTEATIAKLTTELKAAEAEASKVPPLVSDIEKTVQNVIAAGKVENGALKDIEIKAQSLPSAFSDLKNLAASIPKPAGLTPLILDARLRRLKIEAERIDLRLDHQRTEVQLLTDFDSRIVLVAGSSQEDGWCEARPKNVSELGMFRFFLDGCPKPTPIACADGGSANSYGACPREKLITTIARLSKAAQGLEGGALDARDRLTDLLSALGFYTSIVGTQQFLLESADIEQQYSETLFQLRMLELDSEEHVVMLGAGIEGLAIYEKGGIRSEDVARLIQASQAAAISAIAARGN